MSTVPARPTRVEPVTLAALAALLTEEGVEVATDGDTATTVRGVSLSTARVAPDDLYAALPGTRAHGADFAREAQEQGAVAVLTDPDGAERLVGGVPVLVVPRPREVLGVLAARVYGRPATRVGTVAVTGTQGKTTTTRLLEGAWQHAGVPAAVIGTLGTRVAGEEVPSTLTTPEAPDLHALFAVMVERGVAACVMEVSSHALVMGRVDGVRFDVAVFCNLGRDHLDFHDDVESYFAAKASLFTPGRARQGLVNADDPYGQRLLARPEIPLQSFSPSGQDADWRAVDVEAGAAGSRFTVLGPDGLRLPAACWLPGDFNVANTLAAVAAAHLAGHDAAAVADGIAAGVTVPGRLERVSAGQDFLVVVDYAHKPDAIAAAVGALRPLGERMITVLGAGGDRDTGKRPVMGEIAGRLSDVLVVTDDNPRSEDPAAIRAALRGGAESAGATVVEVAGRRAAIAHALALAGPGDVVLLAGKGHEPGQEVAGVVHPFDDRDVAREELAGVLGRSGPSVSPGQEGPR